MAELRVARSELILGGQKSGKTARSESLAAAWLEQSTTHRAVYIATAQAWDDEMRERIARHRRDRAVRVPRMETVEEPVELAHAIGQHSRADTLIVVDCLTLWLTAQLMPAVGADRERAGVGARTPTISQALKACAGPIILISNEIGLGVIPLGRDTRAFVDALGGLNQQAAAACERVTLMSAGLPLTLKGAS
ncbi:bifunctional adenosylcobinamide kinase/adenosylcobinamide-phosphate guanylyltransferase [Ramlibacter sp. WS9]|uniref:bifunctional adenosylcobinamide kinase/adenosylcobinamide-phosphate guanylyltransferase n=1 Tax=Ramlibacter sp. WS9 TaxID=1882741 RepID=UPI0011449246|nr:bifunctional adenosylcobinamide kinase/adenosylcobinamide-phosphate guanylyltransferase [Ramlibacter sp. WS9]ROZ64918.1 bifunctional adenosylcobinamide kinase/adenosylcobinamide-phosphate guanylyltransferase [Ramlibacter sp. WS9]